MACKCDQCPFTAPFNSLVKKHQVSVHSVFKHLKCAHSGCRFSTTLPGNLRRHSRTHETRLELRKPYPCEFDNCEYRATEKKHLQSHILARHRTEKTKDFQCPLCSSRFYSDECLQKHIPRHVREKRFKCRHCKFKTHEVACLTRHTRTIHGNLATLLKCTSPGCSYSTVYLAGFKLHSKTHHPDPVVRRPYQCGFPPCTFRASTAANLERHHDAWHNPNRKRQFQCPMCPKSFYRAASVAVHLTSAHTKEQGYRCDQCPFVTHSDQNLRKHLKVVHKVQDGDGKLQKKENVGRRWKASRDLGRKLKGKSAEDQALTPNPQILGPVPFVRLQRICVVRIA